MKQPSHEPPCEQQTDLVIRRVNDRMPRSVTPETRMEIHPSEWLTLTHQIADLRERVFLATLPEMSSQLVEEARRQGKLPPASAQPPGASQSEITVFAFNQLKKRIADLERALHELLRGYVSTLETARERILFYGGQCDDVPTMERGDPHLLKARATLTKRSDAP